MSRTIVLSNNKLDFVNGNISYVKFNFSEEKIEANATTFAATGALAVTGASTLSSTLAVSGASTLSSTLVVTGASNLNGALTANGPVIVNNTSVINGGLTANGTLAVNGALTANSTLAVTGASTLSGGLTVTGASTLNGHVTIVGDFTVTGSHSTLNTTETVMIDKTITMGSGNTGDASPMSLNMAYKESGNDYTAGLRRKANDGGFLLFKKCVSPTDINEVAVLDKLTVDTLECFSDMNLKKNIVTIDGALDKLDGIRGVYHDWINTRQSEDRQIGVIAQEVQAVYPELVHENENGYLSVNYPKLTAVLLQSIKELKAMVLAICAKQA